MTTRSVQAGIRSLGQACYQLFRNPASHSTDGLSEQEAREQLAVMSIFARWIERCEVLRSTPFEQDLDVSSNQEVR
jgi:hypothetical protein